MLIELLDERLNYRDPAYWNGCGPEDSCPWTQEHKYPTFLFDPKAAQFTKSTLIRFFDHDMRFPIRRCTPGQVFDASKYELETVVRFTKELLIIHDINHNSRFLGEIYAHWGVVTNHHHRGVQERGLVYVAYAPLEAKGVVRGINPMLYYLEDSPLTVSEVHHEKVRYEDPNGLTVEHEHLSRITLLEVMEAADEGTKAITQEAARLLLNPVPRPA